MKPYDEIKSQRLFKDHHATTFSIKFTQCIIQIMILNHERIITIHASAGFRRQDNKKLLFFFKLFNIQISTFKQRKKKGNTWGIGRREMRSMAKDPFK